MDPNANVERKNIATLETELFKEDAVALNRFAMYRKLSEMYGTDVAEEYILWTIPQTQLCSTR